MQPILISLKEENGNVTILVVMTEESIGRITKYDPMILELGKFPSDMDCGKARGIERVVICYATADEVGTILSMLRSTPNPMPKVVQLLSRGFAFRPDLGDCDANYVDALKTH
jgi:hypothetical protein